MRAARPSTLSLMRGIAGLGLLFAGFTSDAGTRTVAGLAVVGLTLWVFDLVQGRVPEEDDAIRGRGVVIASLSVMLLFELAAVAISAIRTDEDLTLFYGMAALFQVAAIATTARCGPDDLSLVAWGACHGSIAFSAAVILLSGLGLVLGGQEVGDFGSLLATGLQTMTVLSLLFLGAAFLLLMSALALGLLQESDRRRQAWMTLILAQAAMLVLFLRWPWNRP